MNQLYPLRPIQIIDTAFNLSRKTFVKFLLISLSFVLPLQIIAWIIEVAASGQESELVGRTTVSYTHLRAHEPVLDIVCRLLLEQKKD